MGIFDEAAEQVRAERQISALEERRTALDKSTIAVAEESFIADYVANRLPCLLSDYLLVTQDMGTERQDFAIVQHYQTRWTNKRRTRLVGTTTGFFVGVYELIRDWDDWTPVCRTRLYLDSELRIMGGGVIDPNYGVSVSVFPDGSSGFLPLRMFFDRFAMERSEKAVEHEKRNYNFSRNPEESVRLLDECFIEHFKNCM